MIIDEIESHFASEYPNEGCGILYTRNGEMCWKPCKNIAKNPSESFEIPSDSLLEVLLRYPIVGIVHSHPDGSPEPSEHDIESCNASGFNYYIFVYPSMVCYTLEPRKGIADLIGRKYLFGIYDCFEAMRDFYSKNLNIYIPPRKLFEENWWEKGLNYFSSDNVSNWNFYPTNDIQENDLLVFSVMSEVPNHCGVYTGNNEFYHHALNRLSCIEELKGIWMECLSGAYRYEP